MTELHPCPACQRHVRGTTCPFCGATAAQRTPVDLGVGRVSRAVVFASATLAASACAHHAKPVDEQGEARHGGGDCVGPDEAKIKELEAQKAEIQKQQPPEPGADQALRNIDEELEHARQPNCAPYGAPPARRRVV
jgi:hypothetical protein